MSIMVFIWLLMHVEPDLSLRCFSAERWRERGWREGKGERERGKIERERVRKGERRER
jgi:hypothetical protein